MRPVIVTRRPDGIIQIRPRRAWRTLTGPVPVAILALLLLSMLALASLAILLVRAPVLVLLAGGFAFLVLAAARYALQDRHTVLPAHASSPPRPPLDAA